MEIKNFLVDIDSSILDIYESFYKTGYKFCIIINGNTIHGVISDGDIIRAVSTEKSLNLSIKEIVNTAYTYLREGAFSSGDLLEIFLSKNIFFIPILNKNNELVDIVLKEKLYSQVLLQDNIKDDNTDDIFSRPWGFYKSIYLSKYTRSKIICVYPNQRLSLQKHKHREEYWIVINGKGKIILEDSEKSMEKGTYFFIPKGTKHRVINTSKTENLYFAEVQLGDYFGEDDIIRFDDDYGRVN